MYLTKNQFISNSKSSDTFVVKTAMKLVLALDNEFLETSSTIILEKNSSLKIIIIQDEIEQNLDLQIFQKSNTNLQVFIITNTKNGYFKLNQKAIGQNSNFELYGIALNYSNSTSTINISSKIEQANCRSYIIFNNTLNGEARTNFLGSINISKDAENANVYLANENLLLSNKSKIDSLPVLQIFNPNVQAKHAATSGFLRDKEILYLQSRGLSLEKAKQLLVQAFNQKIVNELDIICFRERFSQILNQNE